jgi:hypothetical protein
MGHLVSDDGVTWEQSPYVGSRDRFRGFNILETANGRVFKLDMGVIYSSFDMNSWQTNALPVNSPTPRGIAFGNSTYVIVGDTGYVALGGDLGSLSRIDSPVKNANVHSVAANGNTIVGATGDYYGVPARMIVSTNGGRTFDLPPNLGGHLGMYSVKCGDGRFVAVGENWHNHTALFLRSADGITWNESGLANAQSLTDVTFANGLWVAIGRGGTVVTSPDGAELNARQSGTDVNLFGVASGAGVIVAVGESGAILRSTNAVNWTLNGTVEGSALSSVAYGNGIFVAVGESGRVYTSATGQSWTARRILGANMLARVAFAHGVFTAIESETGKIYASSNGVWWSSANVGGPLLGTDASDGKLWISGKNSLVFREASMAPTLSSAINIAGHFRLDFDAPVPGNYVILSAPACDATAWESRAVLQNVGGRVTWEDTNALGAARFYSVRREAR